MPTLVTHSELLRRAVEYVSEARAQSPGKALAVLLDEAAMQHNLSPLDAETLTRLFSQEAGGDSPVCPDGERNV